MILRCTAKMLTPHGVRATGLPAAQPQDLHLCRALHNRADGYVTPLDLVTQPV